MNIKSADIMKSYHAFKEEVNSRLIPSERIDDDWEMGRLFSFVWDSQFGYGPFYAKDIKSVMNEMHEYIIE